jgi:hypothetical protein
MISEILAALKLIIPEVRTRGATQTQSEKEFLTEIVDTCEALVEIPDATSDQAKLLHEKLKVYYDVASERLAVKDDARAILMDVLSSARIYYWVRVLENEHDDVLPRILKNVLLRPLNNNTNKELVELVKNSKYRYAAIFSTATSAHALGGKLLWGDHPSRSLQSSQPSFPLPSVEAPEVSFAVRLEEIKQECLRDIAGLRRGDWSYLRRNDCFRLRRFC